MKRIYVGAMVVAGALLVTAPAGAVTNGSADGAAHPNVGGLVSPTQYSDGTWLYCTGTLISPTVFLTAAHCADDGIRVQVTFDTAYVAGDVVHDGTFVADPLYSQAQSDPHDLAVVVFDQPVKKIKPASLPAAGSLAQLSSDQQFTAVGYGAYEVAQQPGGKVFLYNDVRMAGVGTLNTTNPAWLRISMNATLGNGGGCYGDSGGPNFLGSSGVLAATTIAGDAVCRSTNLAYRLDTPSARSFLAGFVALP